MNGVDLLWLVYAWLPTAVLADFVILQLALRWSRR